MARSRSGFEARRRSTGARPSRGPATPGVDIDGDDRTGRRLAGVLLVLAGEFDDGSVEFGAGPDDPGDPVDPDPPQRRPVLAVVVDQKRRRGVYPQVVEASQGEG